MQRNDFIKKTAASFVALNSLSVFDLFSSTMSKSSTLIEESDFAKIDDSLRQKFNILVKWLKDNKWEEFLLKNINQGSISWNEDQKLCSELSNITRTKDNGFDDFGGNKLIELGNPSLSLLYHALASPRVKDKGILAYPSIEQLDTLENFIYGLKKWEDYSLPDDKKNLHLMVLAYEYRPAFKTPALGINLFENKSDFFTKHAQLVFSRAGISRIGNHEMNYDNPSRSYTNKPIDANHEKEIAVTPARFGVFLVELTEIKQDTSDKVKVMNVQKHEYTTYKGSSEHLNRQFIKPIRKIFDDDAFQIKFGQYHLNQKLYKFSQFELNGKKIEDVNSKSKWNVNTYPFKRVKSMDEDNKPLTNHSNDSQLVILTRKGASVLLSSTPNNLIRVAEQNGNPLSFFVEPKWERRYNALKLSNKKNTDIYDSFITELIYRRNRLTSKFRAMRNAPLFVNIKYQNKNGVISHIVDEKNTQMEETIKNGAYNALLFEDSMCDGCVSASVILKSNAKNGLFDFIKSNTVINPAFSIVAAPDFFPYLDSNDIRKYYHSNLYKYNEIFQKEAFTDQEQQKKQKQLDDLAISNDEHFLEGGSLNLSGIRQRGNPEILDPFTGTKAFQESYATDKSFDTLVAVTANSETNIAKISTEKFKDNYARDYTANSFLPDTGTGIFFPGWDVTYSGEKGNPYFGTFGLGSPFPEDMKLCAAANGMWPVASPDAGRTFQGSLEPFPILGRPNTSIPLMDEEIGYHEKSPQVLQHRELPSYGWDGEQGPFLLIDEKDSNKLKVNFTDIGRADYVENLLNPTIGFNMSKLRGINSSELINRMDCIRKAIKSIDKNNKVSQTNYWLISAEKVANWDVGANAFGIPDNLIGNSNSWAKKSKELNGAGYLFVFAKTKIKKLKYELEEPNSKRRNQLVKTLTVCKVSIAEKDSYVKIEWCEFGSSLPKSDSEIKWLQ